MPKQQRTKVRPQTSYKELWIPVALVATLLLAYWQVLHFDFVSFDDPDYVTSNTHVRAGLTMAGAAWAFGTSFAGNWFPLTWLSRMLDYELFGMDSGWHHFTNVLTHELSTLLLFVVLKRITAATWKGADGHYNLGIAFAQDGKLSDAEREFSATVRLRPDDGDARFNLGITLARLRRVDESIVQLSEAVRMPGAAEPREALEAAMNLKRRSGGR